MPRTRRPSQGKPGGRYPNRTDLAMPAKQQPITVPKGMPYGQGKKIEMMQADVGLPASTPPPAPSGDPFAQTMAAAQSMPFPKMDIERPSERPSEPVTAGLPIGAGPGPESLGPAKGAHVSNTLQRLADTTKDPELVNLANIARSQGL